MDWVALLAALPALIASLGDHLPGLLVAGVMLYVYIQREREHKAEQTAWIAKCQGCNVEANALVEKCITVLQSVADRLTAYERELELDKRIEALAAERKSREDHANAGTTGQG
jgi:hypothetical protein